MNKTLLDKLSTLQKSKPADVAVGFVELSVSDGLVTLSNPS